jgi:hypothetical protein
MGLLQLRGLKQQLVLRSGHLGYEEKEGIRVRVRVLGLGVRVRISLSSV